MIKVVTVVGHGIDLLPHFVSHYRKYVDEINIVAYNSELHPNIKEEIEKIIEGTSNVRIVDVVEHKVFDWQEVTNLYNKITQKYPYDWWVIADIDEFHLYPKDNLKELITDCDRNGWDVVRGGFIDRVGKKGIFPKLNNTFIFKQYPMMGFFRYPLSGACPNKICIKKGYVKLTPGQHYVEFDGHTTWRWQGWNHPLIAPIDTHSVQVHHFKWDETCIERIKRVAEVNEEYAYSEEYKKMYEELQKSNFLIDIYNNEFMFESSDGQAEFRRYRGWNKLIKKITSL